MEPVTHFVFVDFENVPGIDLDVLGGHPAVVLLFLGQKSKLKPDLVEQMSRLPCEVRLIKVGVTKKNALDFVLTYHLGAAMARHPGMSCHIITGDKDYDPIIRHLAINGLTVSKHASLEELPFLKKPLKPAAKSKAAPPAKKPAEDRTPKIIARLSDSANLMKPSTEKALRSRIKTDFGKEATDQKVADLVADLKQRGIVNIDEKGKVSYRAT
jgi:citrate lyase gamma subunit